MTLQRFFCFGAKCPGMFHFQTEFKMVFSFYTDRVPEMVILFISKHLIGGEEGYEKKSIEPAAFRNVMCPQYSGYEGECSSRHSNHNSTELQWLLRS